MVDLKRSIFVNSWYYSNAMYSGMQGDIKEFPSGVARFVENYNIVESTFSYEDGQPYGLKREISNSYVRISVYNEGGQITSFSFNYDFEEIERDEDPGNWLVNYDPNYFKL